MVSRTASWRVSAFDRLDEPTGESTSELLHCHDLDATRFPSRGFHARRATWPASLVCTTTVRRAVIAISSTKDQANPNQLHSFTSKPTTRPRPYAVDASQRRQFPPPSDVHRQPECDYWVTPSCWPTASPFFWCYHYCQRLQNWVSPKFSHASDTRSRAAIMGHCDIEPGTLPATFVEELTVL
jgi:hypothetical protein